jgi:hypothetical protein
MYSMSQIHYLSPLTQIPFIYTPDNMHVIATTQLLKKKFNLSEIFFIFVHLFLRYFLASYLLKNRINNIE